MHRFIKYGLVILTVIVLVASVIVTTIALYNPNAYKPLIVQWVEDEKQRKLTLAGNITLTFYPQFSIDLRQVSLTERHSHEAFASIESIQLSLSLWSLLRKQLVVDKFILRRLEAKLIRFVDGSTNIDDLLPSEENDTPFLYNIAHISIENSTLMIQDQKNARSYTLSDLNLSTGTITNTSSSNIKLRAEGDTKSFNQNEADHFKIQLDIPSLQFDANHISSSKISLLAKVSNLKNSINGTFTLSDITSTSGHFSSDMLAIELAAEKNAHIINVYINSPLSGNLSTQELNLSDLEVNLRLIQPQSLDQPISGNLRGDLSMTSQSSGNLRANFSGNLEDSLISAEFNLRNFKQPVIEFALDIDRLNIDRYLSSHHKKKHINSNGSSSTPLDHALDLSLLENWNANGKIRIQSFQSNDISLSNMQFEITHDGLQ